MPFYVAVASTDFGAPIVAASQRQLFPAPVAVDYPETRYGEERTTADGQVIVQQPGADARPRSWIWQNYEPTIGPYERQWQFLRSLRSRTRFESGHSPYIYIRDNETRLLQRRETVVLTLSGGGNTTTTLTAVSGATLDLVGGEVSILSAAAGGTGTGAYQTSTVQGVVGQVLTLTTPIATVPNGARIAVTFWTSPFFRARVLEVERVQERNSAKVRYASSTFRFVIDDPTFSLS